MRLVWVPSPPPPRPGPLQVLTVLGVRLVGCLVECCSVVVVVPCWFVHVCVRANSWVLPGGASRHNTAPSGLGAGTRRARVGVGRWASYQGFRRAKEGEWAVQGRGAARPCAVLLFTVAGVPAALARHPLPIFTRRCPCQR